MSWRVAIESVVGELELAASFDCDDDLVALVGPNGAGKTTLLRTLAGARVPEEGRVEIGGRLLFDGERGIDTPPDQRAVGYVPQGFGLFGHLDVLDNVAFGLRRSRSKTERRAMARDLLAQLDAASLADRSVARLSGGEKQRVALARALLPDPRFLLLDEPLAALDPGARRSVRRFLGERLRAVGVPAMVVTHDVRDVLGLAATVVVIEHGRVTQVGSADSLADAPATDFVAEFFDVRAA